VPDYLHGFKDIFHKRQENGIRPVDGLLLHAPLSTAC
jgi:hypothetical protein